MKQKKTAIKIKKSKHNLYNKKKLKSRQALTVVLTIVAACVLAVVGYGIGKPIVNYFQTRDPGSSDVSASSDGISSAPSSASENSSQNVSDGSEPSGSSTSEPTVDPVIDETRMYFLPMTATDSSAALASALAAAKEAGCDTVAVTLKDESGYLHYKTDIDKVKKTMLVKGTLTAEQISTQIKNAGLTPAVKINMLRDSVTPMFFGGFTFANGGGWLDDYPDAGGKRWLSPFLDDTVNYLADIAKELSGAGFEHIICSNVRFPVFNASDISSHLSHLPITDKAKRLEALWNVLDATRTAAENNNAKVWVEMDGADFIKADRYNTGAELAADAEKLAAVGVIVDYTPSSAEKVYESTLTFADKLNSVSAGIDNIAVMVKRTTMGAVPADISRALEESKLKMFVGN